MIRILSTALTVGWCAVASVQEPPRIIFDTDMTGDCDDVGALAMLHALADNGEVDILGCIVSFGKVPYVAGCVDAINTYYGRGNLPIGAEQEPFGRPESHYAEAIASDRARYGHDVVFNSDVPDHVTMYRQLLAFQPDNSVTIVTVGRLKGLYDLLVSEPDFISEFDGERLVKRKVARWVCMGGRYPNTEQQCEANFCASGGADYTAKTIDLFPRPVVFTGWEIGQRILTGSALLADSDDNPAARAYRLWFAGAKTQEPHLRQSWDQTAVMIAVRGTEPWWDVVSDGHNAVDDTGLNTWQPSSDEEQSYVVERVPPADVAAVIDALMAQPPRER